MKWPESKEGTSSFLSCVKKKKIKKKIIDDVNHNLYDRIAVYQWCPGFPLFIGYQKSHIRVDPVTVNLTTAIKNKK